MPDRVLNAMRRPVIDHRSVEFAALTRDLLPRLRSIFGSTNGEVIMYPGSGTAGWEAALVNVLNRGDRILAVGNGHFAAGFITAARSLGFVVDVVDVPWGRVARAEDIELRLRSDAGDNRYRAVLVVHNETSTGVESDVQAVRRAMDAAAHEALLIVDAVSSLASVPVSCEAWQVDVCVAASQKGLMLPPGLALLCVSPKAIATAERTEYPRHFFDWRPILRSNSMGYFPYTPPTLLLFGLQEALAMLDEEGLATVFGRHRLLASGVRAAVDAWGLPLVCEIRQSASQTVTAVRMPDDVDTNAVITLARERGGLSLGIGLGQFGGRAFRIGHLGDLNELEVLATLGGVEMVFAELGIPIATSNGVRACQDAFLAGRSDERPRVGKVAGVDG